ncbi:MAG: metallophosphoesterase [Ruminococcus sp.]|nr:metallophosphoesterase [Ruminococcus sp.]
MMWLAIFAAVILMSVGGAVYLVTRFHRFSFIEHTAERHKALSWVLSAVPLLLIGLFAFINVWTVMIILIHLFVFWVGADIIASFVRRVTKRERRRNTEGAAAIAVTAVYLGIGWFLAHHVFITHYDLTTRKSLPDNGLRIVLIADPHLGITLDGGEFSYHMERISELDPDAVVLAGDFVDDESIREDMVKSCEALGRLADQCGVYFIFGNHDKGYYEGYRDFDTAQLREELERNDIVILEDETAVIDGVCCIAGRQDKSEEERGGSRASVDEVLSGADSSLYTILLDHQPNSYDEEAGSGADLVLSGHTHGGHIFPAGQIGLLMGANDRIYGTENRNGTDFLVTSGISGWAIPFKTGTFSEIVVIDITEGE